MKIFKNSLTKIYFNDYLNAKNIEDNSVDLIFADPPYNFGKKLVPYNEDCLTYFSNAKLILADGNYFLQVKNPDELNKLIKKLVHETK
ncbi:hypothetical protein [Pasteurella multocida]|uniref:hypothetical protein n=1 Tax=Pasteurella multocida TaxID=747 RepID=UPI00244B5193|nr:hypothetical protein [Pasteurella multocida]MDH3002284.1 hypothetical protein [Pasteurella multocida]